ncbi:hypothetical protein Tco_1526060 [Tanacetum coccineum]
MALQPETMNNGDFVFLLIRLLIHDKNGDAYGSAILERVSLHSSTVIIPAVPATDNSPAVPEQTTVETILNMSPENKAHFESEKEAIHLILTGIGDEIYSTVDACKTAHEMWEAIERLQQGNSKISSTIVNIQHKWDEVSYHKLFDILKQYQKKVNELCAERMSKNANPLELVAAAQTLQDSYYQTSKSHKSYAPTSKASLPSRSYATTRHKGKEIAKPITPPSESASKEDSDPEQAQKDKDMQKNLALIAKYFKKLYKPTNNNLRTSSNTRNKNVGTTPRCATSSRAKQSDWIADTDEEIDEQEIVDLVALQNKQTELEEYMAFNNSTVDYEKLEHKFNETLGLLAQKDIDIKEGLKLKAYEISAVKEKTRIPHDQSDPANRLIPDREEILTLEEESRSKLNKDLVKPYDYTMENSLYEIFKPPTQEYQIQLAHANEIRKKMWRKYFVKTKPNIFKNIDFLPVSKSISKSRQAYNVMTNNISHLKDIVDQAWVKHSNDHINLHPPTAQDMQILIKTCLMPLALKTQNDSFAFVHELKLEMHADLKYVESLEDEIDELESDKAKFSNVYDMLLQKCVSNDVMCSYLHSLSALDTYNELQCLYLHKVKECDLSGLISFRNKLNLLVKKFILSFYEVLLN